MCARKRETNIGTLASIVLLLASQAFAQTQPSLVPAGPPPSAATPSGDLPSIRSPQAVPLGDGRIASLSRSNFYISPMATSLGSSQRGSTSDELRAYYRSSSRQTMTRVPEMFGDFRRPGVSLDLASSAEQQRASVRSQFLDAGGVSGLRIAENNHALPQDRVWFGYNYFHNAVDIDFRSGAPVPVSPTRSVSLDRFLIGWERVLFDGHTSIEVRLPLASAQGISGSILPGANAPYRLEGGSAGNLSLVIKRLLAASDSLALAYGLGIELPTGSSSTFEGGGVMAGLDPTAVHLIPFVAMTRKWNDRWFSQGFAQVDVPSSGDTLNVQLNNGLNQSFRVKPSALLQLDTGLGYFLSTLGSEGSRGVAIVAELHYSTQLSEPDSFEQNFLANGLVMRVNSGVEPISSVLNSTVGLQAVLAPGWGVRAGVATPLRDERIFDTELFFQINRKF